MRDGCVNASEGFGGYRDDSVPGDRPLPTSHDALTSVLSLRERQMHSTPPVTPISNCVIQFCRGKRCLPGEVRAGLASASHTWERVKVTDSLFNQTKRFGRVRVTIP